MAINDATEPFDWDAVAQTAGVPPEHVANPGGFAPGTNVGTINGKPAITNADPAYAAPTAASDQQAAAPAGGFDRTQFRDQWMANAGHSPQDLTNFIAQNPQFAQGVQQQGDRVTLPTGERLDLSIDSGPGGRNAAGWTTDPGQAAQYAAQYGGGQPSSLGQMSAQGGPGGIQGPSGQIPGFTPYDAPAPFSYSPLSQPGAFTPPSQAVPTPGQQSYQNATAGPAFTPQQVSAQSLTQPGALNYQSVASPQSLTAQQVASPQSLTAQQVASPTALSSTSYTPGQTSYDAFQPPPGFVAPTADEAKNDPGYQFRLQQGADLLQNSAAAKGALRTGNTAKGLIDYGQNAASQEYQNVYNRALAGQQNTFNQGFQTNQANNAGNLNAFNANQNIGLQANQQNNAFGLQAGQANINNDLNATQANNQNALNFGQANIGNALNATNANNAANLAYGGQNFNQGLAATNANNSNALQFGQQNIANQQNTTNQNNANALAFGGANNAANLAANQNAFTQANTVNQENNAGNNAAIQNNFQNALAGQNQGYTQAANTYGLNTNTALQGQNQAFTQGLAANQANTGNALSAWQANNAGALGYGNLGLGQQQANNAYALGQGNLALGNTQAANSYNLGLGNLGLGQQQTANSYNLGLGNLNLGLGQLGLNATQGYGTNLSNLLTGQGNSTAAGQVGSANAWNGALSGIGNNLLTNAYLGQFGGTKAQGV